MQERLIEAGREFWQEHVERGVPPAPSGTDADGEALNRLWPDTIPDPPATIEDELAELILSDYLAHSVKAKEHARRGRGGQAAPAGPDGRARDGARRQLAPLLEAPERAPASTAKRLKAERPEIAAEYSRTSESRVFGVPKEIS